MADSHPSSLIVMCGRPCSGKSSTVDMLKNALKSKGHGGDGREVLVCGEDELMQGTRDERYKGKDRQKKSHRKYVDRDLIGLNCKLCCSPVVQ